jgi:hypothetical protein
MFRTGYILSRRADFCCYLMLPYFAFVFALICQQWLTAVALTSILLLVNGPHNFVTLLRVYGLKEDRHRFADRLIVGAIVLAGISAISIRYAPLAGALAAIMWNHQHQLMQIHGFSRIYDFKARTGAASTPRWDFWLNIVLYSNLFITLPLYTGFWLRELYRFGLPVSVEGVQLIHQVSWALTAAFGAAYTWHVVSSARRGIPINPVKYVFIGSTYAVLYSTGWMTDSLLVHTICAQIMHGVQYIVIVYHYIQRKTQETSQRGFVAMLSRPGNVLAFLVLLLSYAVVIQLLTRQPIDELGFGVISFMSVQYESIPAHGIPALSGRSGYELAILTVINTMGVLHVYYDSFIWKVRDGRISKGL